MWFLGHQLCEEDTAHDCPKPSSPPKSLYQKFSRGLFQIIYVWKLVSFPKWKPGVIAQCGSEQMHISWFLWGSHTGEKRTGLSWGFVSCCTTICQSMSQELAKSWRGCGDLSCFQDTLFPMLRIDKSSWRLCLCWTTSMQTDAPHPFSPRSWGNSSWSTASLALPIQEKALAAKASF